MYRKLKCTVLAVLFLGLAVAPASAALEDGLTAYYKMDEVSGEIAADASGNGNDGTLVGPTLEWIPGYDGGALGCGAPADAEVPDGLEFSTTGMSVTAGTIALWAYLNDPQPETQGRYFFGHTTDPRWNSRIQIYMQDGTLPSTSLDLGLGSAHTLDTDIMELPMEEWLHVAVTWDNGAYAVYVDGAQVSDGTYTGLTALHPTASFANDGSTAPYEAFSGRLDEARVYNRALSAAEVKEIVELPATPRITAWAPDPADGAMDVILPLLRWTSLDVIRQHNVYVGTDPNLTEADLVAASTPTNLHYHAAGIVPGQTYYWRVDEIALDGTVHSGTVWSFMAQPETAYYPAPADGSRTVLTMPDLTWLAGQGAGVQHQVYFSDSLEAVEQGAADADQGILEEPNFAPACLAELTTYYWRVDEIGATGTVVTGEVWNFATMEILDDFESYTDDLDGGQAVFQTWIDGYENGTGATVGYFESANGTFGETTIVHSGGQSMPMDYNNVNSPWYSEANYTLTATQNWAAKGVDALVMYIQGQASNDTAPLYMAVEDTAQRRGIVVHPDSQVVKSQAWVEWIVPLSAFADAGVNLASVKMVSIGAGDPDAPTPGGAGLVYIDSVGLALPAPVAE